MSNNRLLRHTVLGIAVAASIATTGMAAEAVRVLILSGQNVHDWKATTPFLEGVYANSGRFRVVGTVEDVSRITADTFARCDVIVSNWTCHPVMTGGPWAPEGKKAFGDAIRSGLHQLNVGDPFRVGAVILSGIYLLGLAVLIWAPETKGQPLPED